MENSIQHLAIIMDGNQRWSKKNKKKIIDGYLAGFEKLEEILICCKKNSIKYVTVFALSTENIDRNSSYLIFQIMRNKYKEILSRFFNKNINVNIIGEKTKLPQDILEMFSNIDKVENPVLDLNIAFNYGSQNEIIHIINDIIKKKIKKIDFSHIRSSMYLSKYPDPEILIRTGGFKRLSNFIMLNLSYTELFFTKTLWPDFTIQEFEEIVKEFNNIKRNYGL